MRKAFILLALVSSVVGMARTEEIKTHVKCRPAANIADGGFYVKVVSGGLIGSLRAEITEQTFAGPREIGTYNVKKVNNIDTTEFLDTESEGRLVRLFIDYSQQISENTYGSFIQGNLVSGAFSDLSCVVYH